jgi:hypothetical protein
MQFSGTVSIAASRSAVWAFLMDPNQVGSCGPGVESIEVIDEDHFKAKAKVGVGFISARFVVDMTVAERTEPDLAISRRTGRHPARRSTRRPTCACPGPPRARRRWTGRGRRDRGHDRVRRRAPDRGDGQQDDRPDVRLHPRQARGRLSGDVSPSRRVAATRMRNRMTPSRSCHSRGALGRRRTRGPRCHTRAMTWTCPRCGAPFANRDATHSCVSIGWTSGSRAPTLSPRGL